MDLKKIFRLSKNLTSFKNVTEVAYFVTAQCNFRCDHCFNWKDLKSEKKDTITIEELKTFTKSLPKLIRVLLTGGEPFLRKDLDEVCYAFYKNNDVKHISIPTNLSLPNTILMVEKILKKCPGIYLNISPSLDNLKEKRDKFVHRKNSFKEFLPIYEDLMSLSRKNENLLINIITTFNKNNEKEIDEIFNYITQVLKPDSYAISLVRSIMEDGTLQKNLDINKYKDIVEKVYAYNKTRRGIKFVGAKMFSELRYTLRNTVINTYQNKKYIMPCFSGKVRLVLKNDGIVYPCEIFMTEKTKLSLGNLRDYNFNFKKIMESPSYKQVLKYIKTKNCFCHSECDYYYNLLFNPKYFFKMLLKSYIFRKH